MTGTILYALTVRSFLEAALEDSPVANGFMTTSSRLPRTTSQLHPSVPGATPVGTVAYKRRGRAGEVVRETHEMTFGKIGDTQRGRTAGQWHRLKATVRNADFVEHSIGAR